jgi:transposase
VWAYAAHDRPWNGSDPPGVAYVDAPNRQAERPIAHLDSFKGILQVDGYAGYRRLAERGDVQLAFFWVHVRRNFYKLATPNLRRSPAKRYSALPRYMRLRTTSAAAARGAPDRAAAEESSVDRRIGAMASRKTRAGQPEGRARRSSPLCAVALGGPDPLPRRRPHRARHNAVERSIRPITPNGRNALFAGSDGGVKHSATIASLIETCKLNDIGPLGYLTDVLTRIANGHPNRDIDALLPWAYRKQDFSAVA